MSNGESEEIEKIDGTPVVPTNNNAPELDDDEFAEEEKNLPQKLPLLIDSVNVTHPGWLTNSTSRYTIKQNIEISIVEKPEELADKGFAFNLTKEEAEILDLTELWFPILRSLPCSNTTFKALLNAENSAELEKTCCKLAGLEKKISLSGYEGIRFCLGKKDIGSSLSEQSFSITDSLNTAIRKKELFVYLDDSSDIQQHAKEKVITILTIVKNIAAQYAAYKAQNTIAIYNNFHETTGLFLHYDDQLNEYKKSLYMNAEAIDFSRSLILDCEAEKPEQARTKLETFMGEHFKDEGNKTFSIIKPLLNHKQRTVGYAVQFSSGLFDDYIKLNKNNKPILPEKKVVYSKKNLTANKLVNYWVPPCLELLTTEDKDFKTFLLQLRSLNNSQKNKENDSQKKILRVLDFEFSSLLEKLAQTTIKFGSLTPKCVAYIELKLPLVQEIYKTYKAVDYIYQKLERLSSKMYLHEDKEKGKFYLRTAYQKLSEEETDDSMNELKTEMACTNFSDQSGQKAPIGIDVKYDCKAGKGYETQLVYIYIELNEKRFRSLTRENKPNSLELAFKDYKTEQESSDKRVLKSYLQDIESGAIEKEETENNNLLPMNNKQTKSK